MNDVKTSLTVEDLDKLVAEIFAQNAVIEEKKRLLTEENKKLAVLENSAVTYLKELGREKYASDMGTISISEKWRFNLPQTDEDKAKFFDFLRSKGVYDKYATVHATAYNSFCLAEWEIAKAEGRGFDFSLPGVPEPKLYEALSVRKAR